LFGCTVCKTAKRVKSNQGGNDLTGDYYLEIDSSFFVETEDSKQAA